jgi:hypothetical protein
MPSGANAAIVQCRRDSLQIPNAPKDRGDLVIGWTSATKRKASST